MSASDGAVEIEALGLDPNGDQKPATPETFTLDVTTKPLISLVWTGFYVMMLGGAIALYRRGRESSPGAPEVATPGWSSRPNLAFERTQERALGRWRPSPLSCDACHGEKPMAFGLRT
jgi:hypothetical protein